MSKEFFDKCSNNKLEEAKAVWDGGGVDLEFAYAGYTALFQTVSKGYLELTKWLIEIGAPLEWRGSGGKTALIRATELGKADMVALLLAGGADKNATDSKGATALDYAEARRNKEIIALLNPQSAEPPPPAPAPAPAPQAAAKPAAPPTAEPPQAAAPPQSPQSVPINPNKTRTFFGHCESGKLDMAKPLWEQGGIDLNFEYAGNTALMKAADKNLPEVVAYLLEIGSPINTEVKGQTALTRAARRAANTGETESLTTLLEAGAEIRNELIVVLTDGRSSAFKAAAAKLLLMHGANPNATDEIGRDALTIALKDDIDIAEDLIGCGADRTPYDEALKLKAEKEAAARPKEKTPEELAEEAAAKLMKKIESTPYEKAVIDGETEVVKYYIEKGEDINRLIPYGSNKEPALAIAIRRGRKEVVEALINAGLDVNEQLEGKYVTATFTRDTDYMEIALYEEKVEIVKLLIEKGFDLSRRDYSEILAKYCKGKDFEELFPLISGATGEYNVNEIGKLMKQQSTTLPFTYYLEAISKLQDINERDAEGKTALHHALETYVNIKFNSREEISRDVNSCDLWLDALFAQDGIDVNAPDGEDFPPLYYACVNTTPRIVKNLLLAGADINALCGKDSAPVGLAAFQNDIRGVSHTSEIIRTLCEFGADVNATDDNGFAMLHAASIIQDVKACQALLENGADATITDVNGYTPLHRLVHVPDDLNFTGGELTFRRNRVLERGDTQAPAEIAELLVKNGANLEVTNQYGETPFFSAFTSESTEFPLIQKLAELGALVDTQDNGNNTCLHYAVALGDMQRLRLLIDKGADPHVKNNNGFSPFELAVHENKRAIISLIEKSDAAAALSAEDMDAAFMNACKNGRRGVAEMLVKTGNIDTTITDDVGRTPLHYIARIGSVELAKFAIKNGVDVNHTDNNNQTALHFATHGRNTEVFRLLLDNGANPNMADDRGVYPIHMVVAFRQNELLADLKRVGADFGVVDNTASSLLHVACLRRNAGCVDTLLEEGADVNRADSDGLTPLLACAFANQKEIAKVLIDAGADIRAKDRNGYEGIHIAAERGFKEIVLLLLDSGSDINSLNNAGFAPLHIAAYQCHKDIFKTLLERGADYNLKTNSGKSCVDIATESGQKELLQLIGIIQNRR